MGFYIARILADQHGCTDLVHEGACRVGGIVGLAESDQSRIRVDPYKQDVGEFGDVHRFNLGNLHDWDAVSVG
jgi:hypothetical protein